MSIRDTYDLKLKYTLENIDIICYFKIVFFPFKCEQNIPVGSLRVGGLRVFFSRQDCLAKNRKIYCSPGNYLQSASPGNCSIISKEIIITSFYCGHAIQIGYFLDRLAHPFLNFKRNLNIFSTEKIFYVLAYQKPFFGLCELLKVKVDILELHVLKYV